MRWIEGRDELATNVNARRRDEKVTPAISLAEDDRFGSL
jgi:hypothetical protein